ncbi:hypothetical protein [Amaricoccus tamworthensis]|uniref:hypothetical protein n=1 Tax=Amaricoccus tamworthensis TaxID=57002 RepID=UPI003C7E80CA
MDYTVALIFGAVIIVVFAWDQFQRPSYDGSRELTRLIEILTPSKMRKSGIYMRAYLVYVVLLLVIYFTLCAYVEILFPLLGLEIAGAGGISDEVGAPQLPTNCQTAINTAVTGFSPQAVIGGQDLSAGTGECAPPPERTGDPMIPLGVSLVMVGLAPSVPILLRVEEKIRFLAHRLSGIPTRLIAGSVQLKRKPLKIDDADGKTYLIAPRDWQRIHHCESIAGGILNEPHQFSTDLRKIMAFRAWVLEDKLHLSRAVIRDGFSDIEADVSKRIGRLVLDLDTLTTGEQDTTDENGNARMFAVWEKIAEEAERLAMDVCVLCVLYVEHEIVPTAAEAERLGWTRNGTDDITENEHQMGLARSSLMEFVSDGNHALDRDSIDMVLWSRSTLAVLTVTFIYGLFFGQNSVTSANSATGQSQMGLALLTMFFALLTYALALFLAIRYHQEASRQGTWRNIFTDNWARWLPDLLQVLAIAAFASVGCRVLYNIMATTFAVGWEPVRDNFLSVLRYAFEYEAPQAMLGPVLALMVILITDAWRSGADRILSRLPILTGLVMAAAGATMRAFTAQVALSARGADFILVEQLPVILRVAIPAGLIGLAVGYYIRGTLKQEFSWMLEEDPHVTELQEQAAE